MRVYKPVYKCHICGEEVGGEPVYMSSEQATQLVKDVILNQLVAGNPYLHKAPMYVIHNCEVGHAGLAQFAGLRRIG